MKGQGHYDMSGMGHLLHMYSQAGGDTENKVTVEKKNIRILNDKINQVKHVLKKEQDTDKKNKLEQKLKQLKQRLVISEDNLVKLKQKMKELLRGAATTAQKAAKRLSDTIKSIGSKFSPKKKRVEHESDPDSESEHESESESEGESESEDDTDTDTDTGSEGESESEDDTDSESEGESESENSSEDEHGSESDSRERSESENTTISDKTSDLFPDN